MITPKGEDMKLNKHLKSALLMLATLAAAGAYGQSDFSFDSITYSGTGCPSGSASVTTAPDQQTVSIIFDSFQAQVPQSDGDNDNAGPDNPRGNRFDARLSQKLCNIAVSAQIPQDHFLEALEVQTDYRGFAQVESGAVATFRAMVMEWKGPRGGGARSNSELFLRQWQGPQDEDWSVTTNKDISIKSGCAVRGDRQVKFMLRNMVMARISPRVNPNASSALIMMDSSDLHGLLKLRLRYRPCGRGSAPSRPTRPTRPGGTVRPPGVPGSRPPLPPRPPRIVIPRLIGR